MKKLITIIIFGGFVLVAGCKKFIDVNDDPNRPINVQESLILPPAELSISHSLNAGLLGIYTQHYLQTVCLNQPVPNTGTYLMTNSEADGDWSNVYVTILNNLNSMINKAETNGNPAYAGVGKILFAYTLGAATDFWGDLPLVEALKGSENFVPIYTAQEDVYKAVQQKLDDGIADLAKDSKKSPASDDFFYGGDLDKWKKLAYTLKARYYMHLTKAPGYTATGQATLALSALENGMSSRDDDFKFSYPGSAGNENPWYLTFLPGSTLVLSSHLVDELKNRNDPRLPVIVAPAVATGEYNGKDIGEDFVGSLEDYSIPNTFYGGASSDNFLLTYDEAAFLKAEATLIKLGAEAAQPIYIAAIQSNMERLGLDPASAPVMNYLAIRGVLTDANALQRIIEEKSTANFLNIENWVDWRRTGFPVLTKVPNALSDIPRRFLYPQSEKISNPQPQQTAKLTDRLWWDAQ
ncbi:SusD/RagB family nutrient-binding outer membrane lipoprotein [Flavihumibacter profundi]|uniref:SusD/RagB family nutrient-binding outer membrane lipoprotein n=1 Tax=Flavihumibacter profundi TaxID=2716883 RepID=UPI001CC78349|nr:SusD/RagB family nutrient-binding outer membrane lipoprotein [Flavihumibacter profundi]MBZ5858906.1 SusD/RagB family nutrient-binding outer membrane lipoprotein [Flavihumibacter profundi]